MRRRRPAVTWFPTLGSPVRGTSGETEEFVNGFEFTLIVPAGDDPGAYKTVTTAFPITFDLPRESNATEADTTMADIVGSEYLLRRIVGKLFLQRQATASGQASGNLLPDNFPTTLVGAGFFVARAGTEAGIGPDIPSGWDVLNEGANFSNFSPLGLDTVREPWIWRRTWLLGSRAEIGRQTSTTSTTNWSPAWPEWPSANWEYPGVLDGPHIDSKTRRRVTQDDRLWFAASATHIFDTYTGDFTHSIDGYLDYRLIGSLRKARNRGVF